MTATPERARQGVRHVQVGQQDAGQRLDNFLARHLKGVPRSRVYKMLRKGEVRVNRKRAKADYRVEAGDEIRLPPVHQAPAGERASVPRGVREQIEGAIVYEDDVLLVVDKPAGFAVHGGSGLAFGLIEALREARPNQPFLELGHRLDRDTSGCLVIAKTRPALNAFHQLLREGGVEKHYLALVAGRWQGGARRVDEALARTGRRGNERLVEVDAQGKSSVSHFEPVRHLARMTLMDVRIDTGRTHQIRVHAAHLGHPLAGDDKYGDFELNRELRILGLKRLFLHAARLTFQMPGSGTTYNINAPLPPELQQVLHRLDT
ncbi:MAG TPA: RluA family pseudouridine synthase [Thioalkalivibrio sp.]|nr:RluA family pseudouridine synthase [Thioalkalivibrio sp.]